jgi:hypothetical protein
MQRFARDLESLLSRRMRERLEAQRYSGGGTYDAFLDQSRRSAHVLMYGPLFNCIDVAHDMC